MHSLLTQISGLAALLVLLNGLWGGVPLSRVFLLMAGVGLASYGVLLAGRVAVRYILAYAPPPTAPPAEGGEPAAGGAAPPAPAPSAQP